MEKEINGIHFENVPPKEIERRSFELLTNELCGRTFNKDEEPIIKRVIHTSADFDYAEKTACSCVF